MVHALGSCPLGDAAMLFNSTQLQELGRQNNASLKPLKLKRKLLQTDILLLIYLGKGGMVLT